VSQSDEAHRRHLEQIDLQLREAIDELVRRERAGELDEGEITRAQEILFQAASWLRGLRPPRTFDEAWRQIDDLHQRQRLEDHGWR